MGNSLRRLAVVTALVAVFAACSSSDGSPDVCEPDLLTAEGDVQAPGQAIEVWALLFASYEGLAADEPVFVPVGEEVKIVWRVTGEGEVEFRGVQADGSAIDPIWGPQSHLSSTWDTHPGDEWGTGWVFPESGCWSIEVTRGADVAYLDVDIRP